MILVALSLALPTSFNCRLFLNRFCVCSNLFVLFFLVTPCLVVAVQPCIEYIPIKKKKIKIKDHFSSRTVPSIFTSIAPVLLDWSIETSWVFSALKSTNDFLAQSIVSWRSDSISEANSSRCHRSDAWSHLEWRLVSA